MLCPQCNAQLSDDAKFCANCGANVSNVAPAAVPENPMPEAPAPDPMAFTSEEPAYLQVDNALPEVPAEKPSIKKWIVLGVAVLVSLIALITLIAACSGSSDELPNANYVMYQKDSELFFVDLEEDDGECIQASDELSEEKGVSPSGNFISNYAYLTSDRELLFYPDKFGSDEFTLYFRDVTDESADAVKVDTNVIEYFVNDAADTVVYLKKSDLTENSDVGSLYCYDIGDDVKEKIASKVSVFYASADLSLVLYCNEDGDLYYMDPTDEEDAERISRNVNVVAIDLDNGEQRVLYSKSDKLYRYNIGDDNSEKIASDFYQIVSMYEDGEFYYLTESAKEYTYGDFIKSTARASADSDYSGDQLAFYELHYFDGDESVELCDMVLDVTANRGKGANPTAIYAKIDKSKKVTVESKWDLEDALMEASTWFVAHEDTVIELGVEDIYAYGCDISLDGKTVYVLTEYDYVDYEKGGDLQKITLSGSSVKSVEKVESKVYYGYFVDEDRYLYETDKERDEETGNTTVTLYLNGEKIDSEVEDAIYYQDVDAIYYLTDWDEKAQSYTLKVYKDGETDTVSDDVYSYTMLPNGKIAYLCDYSTDDKEGTLCVYDGTDSVEIDDEVTKLFEIYFGSRYRAADTDMYRNEAQP